jgi:hypothetical protein
VLAHLFDKFVMPATSARAVKLFGDEAIGDSRTLNEFMDSQSVTMYEGNIRSAGESDDYNSIRMAAQYLFQIPDLLATKAAEPAPIADSGHAPSLAPAANGPSKDALPVAPNITNTNTNTNTISPGASTSDRAWLAAIELMTKMFDELMAREYNKPVLTSIRNLDSGGVEEQEGKKSRLDASGDSGVADVDSLSKWGSDAEYLSLNVPLEMLDRRNSPRGADLESGREAEIDDSAMYSSRPVAPRGSTVIRMRVSDLDAALAAVPSTEPDAAPGNPALTTPNAPDKGVQALNGGLLDMRALPQRFAASIRRNSEEEVTRGERRESLQRGASGGVVKDDDMAVRKMRDYNLSRWRDDRARNRRIPNAPPFIKPSVSSDVNLQASDT